MEFFVENFQIFLLVLVRMFGMFTAAPFFSSGVIPIRIRAVFSVYVAVVIFPILVNTFGDIPENMLSYALMIGSEAFIGILIGFLMSIIFAAFQLAARFFSFQMALGIAQVMDPVSQIGISIVGQLWTIMGIMIFIAINGPHMLIMATFESYQAVQVFNIARHGEILFRVLAEAMGAMFLVALKLAFPILITLFVLSVTLGLLAKAAPQMNIFMLGFPIQIGVGFLIMMTVMGAIAFGMSNALNKSFSMVFHFIRALGT
ncbi:MAG TPA: flagellar biosynthetic protein FliR [Spirochaetes bacterium]|nr:flagellar biosynthetic protein FliR [Spirochaetota bacterium]